MTYVFYYFWILAFNLVLCSALFYFLSISCVQIWLHPSPQIFPLGYLEHQSLWMQRCTRHLQIMRVASYCHPLLLLHEISGERKPDPVSWMWDKMPRSSWILFLALLLARCVVLAFLRLWFIQPLQLFAPVETLNSPLSWVGSQQTKCFCVWVLIFWY